MRRSASEIVRTLEMRIAHLEKEANIERDFKKLLRQMKQIERSNNKLERYTNEIERDFDFDLRLSAKKEVTEATVKEMKEIYLDADSVRISADKVVRNLLQTIDAMNTAIQEYRWEWDGSTDMGSLSVSNPSLLKKLEAALRQAKRQQEKAQANHDKLEAAYKKAQTDLRVQKERVQMRSYPKELTAEMKEWYKKIKKYLTDDNLRGARDIKKSVTNEYNRRTKKRDIVVYLATLQLEGLVLTTEYKKRRGQPWYFVHNIKIPIKNNTPGPGYKVPDSDYKVRYKNESINEAVKLFLDFTKKYHWDGRKDLAPKQKLMTPQIKREIADKFQRVIKYFDGGKIEILNDYEIQAYTGDSGYYEAYDGDGAGEPVKQRVERALNRYDKYIEGIYVSYYGDGEWVVTIDLKE